MAGRARAHGLAPCPRVGVGGGEMPQIVMAEVFRPGPSATETQGRGQSAWMRPALHLDRGLGQIRVGRGHPQPEHPRGLLACGQPVLQLVRAKPDRQLADIEPLHVAAYIEALGQAFEKPTVKQHLAAIRMVFDWLVSGQVVATTRHMPCADRNTW